MIEISLFSFSLLTLLTFLLGATVGFVVMAEVVACDLSK